MKTKLAVLLLVLLGAGGSLFAQNPTAVSGTITDPSAVAYYPATVTACLTPVTTDPIVNGQHVNQQIGRNYCAPLANTSPTGFFSLGLFPNSAITPGGTQWQFTVTAAGSAQPAGKGSQTFQVSITISGTSQDVGATLSASAPALLNSGGGGISSVSSLPATCTPGVTAPVQLTVYPFGIYYCSSTNIWSGGRSTVNTIDPTDLGVRLDVKMCRDTNAQFTTSTSVTCLTANFTSADIGKVIFGTCCGIQGGPTHPASTLKLPQGTITAVNSATNVTVSIAGTSTTCATGAAGCLLLWGTDDSAAWDLAWTAATGTAGYCKPMTFSGLSFISTAKFLTTVCNTGITGPGSQGGSIVGYGYKTSMFVILPNFTASTCTGVSTASANPINSGCFGTSIGFQLLNMGIWGGENGNSTQLNGKVFLDVGIDSYLTNVLLAGFASGSGTTMIGVQFEATGQSPSIMVVDGFGGGTATSPSCMVSGGNYNVFVESFCGNTNGRALLVQGAGTILHSYGGLYGQVIGSSDDVDVISGAFLDSHADIFTGPNAGAALGVDSTSSIDLTDSVVSNTTNAGLYFPGSTGGKVRAKNTKFTGSGVATDIAFVSAANNIWQDQGGNIFTGSSATATGCASAAGTCRNYGRGSVAMANPATTITVTTTAVSANSTILVFEDATLGTKLGVTCNATLGRTYMVTTRTAGTSFVITASATPAANSACLNYQIMDTNN